jgi:hypothetical protein
MIVSGASAAIRETRCRERRLALAVSAEGRARSFGLAVGVDQ